MIVVPETLCRAVRLLRHLDTETPVASATLGELLGGLSRDEVETSLRPLYRAGVVRSKKGRRGGWLLMRPRHAIEFSDVAGAIIGTQLQICRGCEHARRCQTARIFKGASQAALEHLAAYTVDDVIDASPGIY